MTDTVVPLDNGSFEQPDVGGGSAFFSGTEIPGWTVISGNVDIVGTNHWAAADGIQTLDLAGNTPGAIEQNVTDLTPEATYEVVFDYAINKYGKGTRTADAVWTMDGVEITDMAAIGASPEEVEAWCRETGADRPEPRRRWRPPRRR